MAFTEVQINGPSKKYRHLYVITSHSCVERITHRVVIFHRDRKILNIYFVCVLRYGLDAPALNCKSALEAWTLQLLYELTDVLNTRITSQIVVISQR